MTTMPVVWCTDPNSVNNKPTAFALHGIQLQGNVTEKQVLALRELVNAAAEGRLILPSDGTFVLLDSGISIESSIVKTTSSSTNLKTEIDDKENIDSTEQAPKPTSPARPNKNTYILMPVTASNSNVDQSVPTKVSKPPDGYLEPKYSTDDCGNNGIATSADDILYEFLCCAKCMNDTYSKCPASSNPSANKLNSLILQRYLKTCSRSCSRFSSKGDQELDPIYTIANKYTKQRQRRQINIAIARNKPKIGKNFNLKCSIQSSKAFHHQHSTGSGSTSSTLTMEFPIYATVKKQCKKSDETINLQTIAEMPCQSCNQSCVKCSGNMDKMFTIDEDATIMNESSDGDREPICDNDETVNSNSVQPDLIIFDDDDDEAAVPVPITDEHILSESINRLVTIDEEEKPTTSNLPRSNGSSRKTSFDSTCTISSMDSGFIEMQNRMDQQQQQSHPPLSSIVFDSRPDEPTRIKVDTTENHEDKCEKIARLNYKECLTQSRNRRKSYEEFKAIFSSTIAAQSTSQTVHGKEAEKMEKSISRRKSYQEFRSMFATDPAAIVGGSSTSKNNHQLESILEQSKSPITANSSSDKENDHDPACTSALEKRNGKISRETETTILRKNSDFLSKILDQNLISNDKEKARIRRKSYEEFKKLVRECENFDAAAAATTSSTTTASSPFKRQNSRHKKTASFVMRRNSSKEIERSTDVNSLKSIVTKMDSDNESAAKLSKSESYMRNFKIYDKLVYGTIYDIIQRKNDIYNLTYQKYDKYMTYGTIYEILHRKTSQSDLFERKSLSAISEKGAKKKDDKKAAGMIYDIIQRHQKQQQDEGKDTQVAETIGATPKRYGTIYDIIREGETTDKPAKLLKNRFLVSKIDESNDAAPTVTDSPVPADASIPANEYSEPKSVKTKKPTKMRRFSNILAYKSSSPSTQPGSTKKPPTDDTMVEETPQTEMTQTEVKTDAIPSVNIIPLDSDELYSRINKDRITRCGQIFKSNSLDAISTSVAISPPGSPAAHSKHQLKLLHQHQKKLSKKLSIDNSEISPIHRRHYHQQLQQHYCCKGHHVPCLLNDKICGDPQQSVDSPMTVTANILPPLTGGSGVPSSSQQFESDCDCSIVKTSNSLTVPPATANQQMLGNTPSPSSATQQQPFVFSVHHHHHHHHNNCIGNNCNCMTGGGSNSNVMLIDNSGVGNSKSDKKFKQSSFLATDTGVVGGGGGNPAAGTSPSPCTCQCTNATTAAAASANGSKTAKKGKSRRLSEFTRGEFLNEKS